MSDRQVTPNFKQVKDTGLRCKVCTEPIVARDNGYRTPRQFCSQACMGAHQRRRITLICESCERSFERPAAWVRTNTRFCSRDCAALARVRPGSTHSRGAGWRRRAEGIRERDGRSCVRCGEHEQRRKHAVDHIVPWVLVKADDRGNHEDNLATLCLRCHGVKTTVTEPRMLRGDWLALREFYGDERSERAMAVVL